MTIVYSNAPERKGSRDTNRKGGKPLPDAWTQSVPGEETTTPAQVYEASQRLVSAGLSVIPIEAYEGSKSPDSLRLPHPHDRLTGKPRSSWSIFKIRRANPDELKAWFEKEGPYGLAVLGGAVSGGKYGLGLEVIDIDTADLADPWVASVERQARVWCRSSFGCERRVQGCTFTTAVPFLG